MIGPYTEEELEILDVLEEQLLQRQIPYERINAMYAAFLLDHLLKARFEPSVAPADVDSLIQHLRSVEDGLDYESKDEGSEIWRRVQLWQLHDRLNKEKSALAPWVRCAVCCFFTGEGWDEEQAEDPTPIPFYLMLLKEIRPPVEGDFLACVRIRLLS